MSCDGRYKPSVSVFSGLVICLLWIGITGVGCQTDGLDVNRGIRPFNSGKKAVDSIRLFTSTALFNLDGESHSNGFSARIFAVHNSIPKPIQIVEGTLEIIIYDGDASRDQSLKPRQVWSFSRTDLPRYLRETSIGLGYDFILKIDRSKPLPGKVSIGAKYTPTNGNSIFAKPVSIAIEL